jgi:hypothetical protein
MTSYALIYAGSDHNTPQSAVDRKFAQVAERHPEAVNTRPYISRTRPTTIGGAR